MPPAARITDPTAHGAPLAPGPGSSNVLIGGLPAWRALEDQHACPAVSVTGPDGVGSVMVGSPTVLINFMQACRMGDIVLEVPGLALGPPDPIVMGCPTVLIGEVGMGGAGSPLAAVATKAKAAAVASHTGANPSKYSQPETHTAPQALATPPAKKKSPAPAKDKKIVCGIKVESLHVQCQHGGRKPKNGLLEVVGSLGGGDTISADCSIIGTCGQHPLWVVDGYWATKKVGTALTFNARDFKQLGGVSPVFPTWLGDASPHVYDVSVSACSGPSYSFVIKSYPNDLQQMKLSTAAYEEKLKKIHDAFKKFLEQIVEHPVFEFPRAAGSCQMQWKEDPKSNLAFYFWQLTLSLDPLVMVGVRLPLGPQAALPAAVRKYVNAGFFAEIKGELVASLNGGQLNPPESEKGHFSGKGEGNIVLTVGGSVFVGGDSDDSPFKIECALQTSVGIELACSLEGHEPVADVEVNAGGLRGYATLFFHVIWDYEKKYEVNLFDKQTVYQRAFHPFEKEKEAGAPE